MKIALIAIGKTDARYFMEAIDEYKNRLAHYLPFEMQIIPDIKNVKNLPESQQKEKEGELILKSLQQGDHLVLLDEKGKSFRRWSSPATWRRKCRVSRGGWSSSSEVLTGSVKLCIKRLPRKYP